MKDLIQFLLSERNFKLRPIIVGFTGHIGVGKTYMSLKLSSYLTDEGYNVCITSVASALKKLIQFLSYKTKHNLNLSPYITEYDIQHFRYLPDIAHDIQLYKQLEKCETWRQAAQTIGAYVRHHYNCDFWIDRTIEFIKQLPETVDFVLVPDVRYLNEYKKLKQSFPDTFILVKIQKPMDAILKSLNIDKETYLKMLDHESEKQIDSIPHDFLINNT